MIARIIPITPEKIIKRGAKAIKRLPDTIIKKNNAPQPLPEFSVTMKDAKIAYAEIVSNYGKDANSSNSTMLYEEFFYTIFLPYYKGRVKERTYNNRLSTIKNAFAFFFKMSLKNIKPIHIQKWQNELSNKYENSYVRNIYGLFQMSLDRAVVLGMMPSNPAKVVGNVKKSKKKVYFWTKEEFEKVIETFYVEDYYQNFAFICIWLLFMTGMRVGEATALTWKALILRTVS